MNTLFNFFKQYGLISVLLAYIIIVVFFGDLLILFPLCFIILFKLFKNKYTSITISYLDVGFAILFISEIMTSFTSTYAFNSISACFRLNLMLILYIGCKVFFKDSKKQLCLQTVFVVFSAVLVFFTLNIFFGFQTKLKLAGFTDSINFKHLYMPLGYLLNAWASILLFFLFLNCLFLWQQRNKKWIGLVYLNLFLICFCILSSFSRGAYISIFFFILAFTILVWNQFSFKKIILYNILALSFITIASLPIKKDVLSTISFNKTESQQRSAASRIDSWIYVEKLLANKPIFGWGQGNFILAQDKMANQKEDSIFCPRTQNTYINLLVERGLFGFASYFAFFVIILIVIIRNFKSKTILKSDKINLSIIGSGVLSILLREFTYASVFEYNSVYFMFFGLLFFLIPYDIPVKKIVSTKLKYGIPLFFLVAISTILYANMQKVLVSSQNRDFLQAFYKNNFKQSQSSIDKAMELAPDNINVLKNHNLFLLKNTLEINISNKHSHLLSIVAMDKDTLQLGAKNIRKILKLNSHDAESLHNLAWINFALANNPNAQSLLEKAIKLDPYNSIYHVSKVLFNLQNENNSEVKIHLIKALRYSPDILESIFYNEFLKKYSKLANESKQMAISELYSEIKVSNNTILKARLARLLLDENPKKAKQLLEEVTTTLPNLSRPWMYLAYLNSVLTNDSTKVINYYEKSLFLNPNDFLLNNYCGNFYRSQHNKEKGLLFLKKALEFYDVQKSPDYARNFKFSNIPVVYNSLIPNNLLYYTTPDPQALPIFKTLEKYNRMNNTQHTNFYSKMVKSYSRNFFKNESELP